MYLRRLTDLRESRNWTQTHVARLLHLQQRAYSRYEDGDRK
ncbi:MAG: helix-turn-helix transcriptional regulator, partial [Lachnospiraceae bacterium]|nr:helix-turn-helix transcriptional regulator [Lachnospiraceae bacterium]